MYVCMYLFKATLGLRCCVQSFSSCSEQRLLFVMVHGLLIVVASLWCRAQALGAWASVVVAHGLSSCGSRALEHRLSSCGTSAQLLRSMWDLPGTGLKPVSPTLAGRFLTTVPPGKSCGKIFNCCFSLINIRLFKLFSSSILSRSSKLLAYS